MTQRQNDQDRSRERPKRSTSQQKGLLQRTDSEVPAKDDTTRGQFTPVPLSSEKMTGWISKKEERALLDAAAQLKSLMTTLNKESGPSCDHRVKELTLLRFEYLLLRGDFTFSLDPQLIADFFTARKKDDFIRPALERLAEKTIPYPFIASELLDHPIFKKYSGTSPDVYKLRARLNTLVTDKGYSKEKAAVTLLSEGFDLEKCDFNRWFATGCDANVQTGNKRYKQSPEEAQWLADLIKKQSEEPLTITSDSMGVYHDSGNLEITMWDNLFKGDFTRLARQLRTDQPHGSAREGLNYNKSALTKSEDREAIDSNLAADSFAMILAGDILVGDLSAAIHNFNDTDLQIYRDEPKIEAAINLAWETLIHSQHDEEDKVEVYRSPKNYLFLVADNFGAYLESNPHAAPYLRLLKATNFPELGQEERKILQSIDDFAIIKKLYRQLGMDGKIAGGFIRIFDDIYDRVTLRMIISSDVGGILETIQDPDFKEYINDKQIGVRLLKATMRTLAGKNKYHPYPDQDGGSQCVLAMYQNPILKRYLDGKLDLPDLLNKMIEDTTRGADKLLTQPYFTITQPYFTVRGEIDLFPEDQIQAYLIADQLRDYVNPEKMKRLVAYLLACNSDMTKFHHIDYVTSNVDIRQKNCNSDYKRPDYFPASGSGLVAGRVAFLTNIYQREQELGGLDPVSASIGVTNVIYRGTSLVPDRFTPQLDAAMQFLDSPVAELLPSDGLVNEALREYRILKQFLDSSRGCSARN